MLACVGGVVVMEQSCIWEGIPCSQDAGIPPRLPSGYDVNQRDALCPCLPKRVVQV